MSLLSANNFLISISKGGAVTPTSIVPINKIVLVDKNGYIGQDVTNYFQTIGNTYNYNFALLQAGANFKDAGLGQVTFYQMANDVIGGRTYKTVTIGGKVWMAENLDFKFSGCTIGSGYWSSSLPSAAYYQNNEAQYGIDGTYKCGLLYNWYAAKYLEDNKSQLIPGWHVPTTSEWDALTVAVGGTSIAGTKLKAQNGAADGSWPTGWNGTDDYEFCAFPSGLYAGSFLNLGSYTYFWTSTELNSSLAYLRYLDTGSSVGSGSNNKTYGYSVRLVKDS